MGIFFAVSGKSPMERAFRTVAMVLIILAVVWAFWKNNENVIAKLQKTQAYWDETEKGKPYIKSFARDFARSMDDDHGITAQVWVVKGELPELDPDEDHLQLALSPSQRVAALAMNPQTDEDKTLIEAIEQGYFDEYWDSGWEAGLESALVMIWNHYSGEKAAFMDSVAQGEAAPSSVVDETGEMTETDLAFVQRFVSGLDAEFGQQAAIRVFEGEVLMPESINRTLFIGLSPARKEVVVSFPPLVKKALPAGFESRLMSEHFPTHFESGDWITGLKTALIKTWTGLAGETETLE